MQLVVSKWGRFWPIFALSALRRRPLTQLNTDSTHILNSTGRRRPLQPNEAAHIIDQVHHADLHGRTRHTDGTYEYAAHPVFLIRKYVLYAGAHPRAPGVGDLLALREGMVAGTPAMISCLFSRLF